MTTLVNTPSTTGLPTQLITSSVGKKFLMAISGVIAFGYVVGHMIGNLQIFAGRDQINAYAEFLHSLGPMLWVIRAFLLLAFIVHIWLGVQLKLENMAARPIGYQRKEYTKASLASRTMIISGLIVLAFFIYHILHFTARVADPRFASLALDSQGRYDVYSMVILGFQNIPIAVFYLLAVGLATFHLSHGMASMFQSLGWSNPKWQVILDRLAWIVSIILFLGYSSIPVSVWFGWIRLPGGGL